MSTTDDLAIRDGIGTGATLVDRADTGWQGEIKSDTSFNYQGFTWWWIDWESGDTGFSAEGDGDDDWLILLLVPEVSRVSPSRVVPSGEDITITITGSDFAEDVTLKFKDPSGDTYNSRSSKLTRVSSRKITYDFNSDNDAGEWEVQVINPSPHNQKSDWEAFDVSLDPDIDSVSPDPVEPSSDNITITIEGEEFAEDVTLEFKNPSGGTFNSVSSRLTWISREEITYDFNNDNDQGTWEVRAHNPAPNNERSSWHSFEVKDQRPDLYFESGTIDGEQTQTTINPGDTISLSVRVKNQGAGTASTSKLHYNWVIFDFYGLTTHEEIYLGDDSVQDLSSGESTGESFSYTVPEDTPSGSYIFNSFVDAESKVTESDEENNNKAWEVIVDGDNPAITAITPSLVSPSSEDVEIIIIGTGFHKFARLTFEDPAGVLYENRIPTWNSSTNLTYSFNSDAHEGVWKVTVNNYDGYSSEAFEFNVGSAPVEPTLGFDKASYQVNEGSEISPKVVRTGDTSESVSVQYQVYQGSAKEWKDFTINSASGTLSFASGESAKHIPQITAIEDNLSESSEYFSVGLKNASNITLGNITSTSIIIQEVDVPVTERDISGTVSFDSGDPSAGVTIKISGDTSKTTTTNSSGSYSFSIPTTGTFYVSVNSPDGYDASPASKINIDSADTYNFLLSVYAPSEPEIENREPKDESKVADPIDTATGAQVLSRGLFTLYGARTLPFSISYNSLQNTNESSLAKGWAHNFEKKIVSTGEGYDYYAKPNLVYPFERIGETDFYGSSFIDMRFHRLEKLSDGSLVLHFPGQTKHFFSSAGRFEKTETPTGQVLNLQYTNGLLSGITEPISGVSLSFVHNVESGKLESVTDTLGRTISFTHGEPFIITDAKNQITKYFYEGTEYLKRGEDFEGRQLFMNVHDSEGRVIQQDDGVIDNQLGTFGYTQYANGNLTTIYTDRMQKVHTYVHNNLSQLISVDHPLVPPMTQVFENSNKTSIVDPTGDAIQIDYDADGNAISFTKNSEPYNFQIDYDSSNRPVLLQDRENNQTYITLENNRVTSVKDPLGNDQHLIYNADNLLEKITTAAGTVSNFTYENGRPKSINDADGNETRIEYDLAGRTINTSKVSGLDGEILESTSYEFDNNDNIISLTNGEEETWTFTYDSHGNLKSKTDPLNRTRTYTYTGNRKVKLITYPDNTTMSLVYDGEDRVVSVTNRRGKVTTYERDDLGRIVRILSPEGSSVRFTYDNSSRITEVFDSYDQSLRKNTYENGLLKTVILLGKYSWTYTYTPRGQIDTVTGPDNKIHSDFDYDSRGLMEKNTEFSSHVSEVEYDADGVQTSIKNPRHASTIFTPNRLGTLESITTPEGQVTNIAYDGATRPSILTEHSGDTISLSYDKAGRLVSDQSNDEAARRYEYNALGNLKKSWREGSSEEILRTYHFDTQLPKTYIDQYGNTIGYTWDSGGNLESLTYPGGKTVTYTWDDQDRLTSHTDWDDRTVTYSYDLNNQLKRIEYPNGLSEVREYLPITSELSTITVSNISGEELLKQAFTYDSLGQVKTEVITPTHTNMSGLLFFQATSDLDNRLNSFETTVPSYDFDGNLKSIEVKEYEHVFTYTARNQLASADNLSYHYNVEGDRVGITDSSTETSYILDGFSPLRNVLISSKSDDFSTCFVYGLGLSYEVKNGVVRYYHFDRRGSTVMISNANATVDSRIHYSPFGKVIDAAGSPETPFLFNGKYGVQSDSNGFYYMRSRYYSPDLKRFLNQDSVLGSITNAVTMNRFAYANGNPVSLIDPFGMAATSEGNGYFSKSFSQFIFGNYTDDFTALGTVAQVGVGLTGLDVAMDIRDLTHDLKNWEWSWGHIGQTTLDGIGLVPVIGAFKYADETAGLVRGTIKNASNTGVQANRLAGQVGENFLKNTYGGTQQVFRRTSEGGRYIDNLIDGIAMESKVGRTSFSSRIGNQITKDTELMNTPGSGITSVEWHFFPSSTGVGPTGPLRAALEQADINIIIH